MGLGARRLRILAIAIFGCLSACHVGGGEHPNDTGLSNRPDGGIDNGDASVPDGGIDEEDPPRDPGVPCTAIADTGPLATVPQENQRPGSSDWRRVDGRAGLAGFADRTSYKPGENVVIHAAAPNAIETRWEVWRMGYYAGARGRRIAAGGPLQLPAALPVRFDPQTGAVSAPWPASFCFKLPSDAVTGMYLVKLIAFHGQSYVPFVVRQIQPTAPILIVMPFTTYQAYNSWGGTSLYVNGRPDCPRPHAFAASFDRPFNLGVGSGNFLSDDSYFLNFVEGQRYDLAYATDVDLDARPSILASRRLIIISGHSEYWTAGMRRHIEEAIAPGTNLAFLGANDIYWQVRYAPSESGYPRRSVVGYKEFVALDPMQQVDPTLITARWRDLQSPRPENAISGTMYGEWIWKARPLIVTDPTSWVWVASGVQFGSPLAGVVSGEVNRRYDNGFEPAGVQEIAGADVESYNAWLQRAQMTVFSHPSGSQVFTSGTLVWTRAVGHPDVWDRRAQQVMANVLARFAGDGVLGETALTQIDLPSRTEIENRPQVSVSTVTTALTSPVAIALGPGDDAIVSDNHRILRVTPAGVISLIAGDGPGYRDGSGSNARFLNPHGLAVDRDGTIYVADTGNSRIRVISPSGDVGTLAGSSDGFADGPGSVARFYRPTSIVLTRGRTLAVADNWNFRIRAVALDGTTSTWAGTGANGILDGPGRIANLTHPFSLALQSDDGLLLVEPETGLIRRVAPDPDHTVSRLFGELNRYGWQDGNTSTASLSETMSIALTADQQLILLDAASSRVRLLADGRIQTLAGGRRADLHDGSGDEAGFGFPRAVAVTSDGNLLVVDTTEHALRCVVWRPGPPLSRWCTSPR